VIKSSYSSFDLLFAKIKFDRELIIPPLFLLLKFPPFS
jgi:hypothetical protein